MEEKDIYRELRDDIVEIKTTIKFLSQQLENMNKLYTNIPKDVAEHSNQINALKEKNELLERKCERLNEKIDKLENDSIRRQEELKQTKEKTNQMFKWFITATITLAVALISYVIYNATGIKI